jgi:hypothetical protein
VFLSPTGDTLFYRRRVDGQDVLYAFQPDDVRIDSHVQLAASRSQLRAWPTSSGQLVVCDGWPRSPGGLRLKLYDMAQIARLVEKKPARVNEKLTDVPQIAGFRAERSALPLEIFERIRDEQIVVPGLAPVGEGDTQCPALYELDGASGSYRVVPLGFLQQTALPGSLYLEPGGERHWLTVGDSSHLFVLDSRTHELAADLVWPVEQQALARVAFNPTRREAWVSAHSSVFIYDLDSMQQVAEVPIEEEERWHRGERVVGFIGGIVFSRNGSTAMVARPLSGDVAEVSVRTRRVTGRIPVAIDPLELLVAPTASRIYMQSLRNGNISWFPLR